jgi:hypothetical protein
MPSCVENRKKVRSQCQKTFFPRLTNRPNKLECLSMELLLKRIVQLKIKYKTADLNWLVQGGIYIYIFVSFFSLQEVL